MPSMTPQISPIASRYANAFLDVIADKKAEKAVASDIESIKSMYADSDVLADFTKDVTVSRADQLKTIDALAKKAKFHEITANFLKLLAKNNRLVDLVEMINAYDVALDIRLGNTVVNVATPFPLKAAQEKKIKAELDKALGANIQIVSEIDKTLIGGVVITVGSKMIDDSVKGKLERLTRAMKSQSGTNNQIKKAS
ncbi:MAG: ATP synthase F1 subunit delta [Alphaproteobacteria bacterium]|nr:ATP synthase F1 subunit delta [Alphaproteobacteria bacterium]